jgi:hypothetical protein
MMRPSPPPVGGIATRVAWTAAVLLALASAHPAGAQLFPGAPRRGEPTDTVRWRRLAGVSPIHLLFGSYAGDYEHALRRDLSLGGGVTYSGPNSILRSATSAGYDVDVSAKVRYYLYGTAPAGASLGATAGFLHGERGRRSEAPASGPAQRRRTVPTLGFTADYNQLVGPTRRVVLGTGYGVKRRYADADDEYERITQIQFTFRVLVGYAW